MTVAGRPRLLWVPAPRGGAGCAPLRCAGAPASVEAVWAWQTVQRVAPILAFVAVATVLAELCDAAGLFDRAAEVAAARAGGSVARLWVLVVVLSTLTTVLLSLDTTAVLLTPAVLATTQKLRLPALPFALLVVYLANAGSLLLPVSNLTNLLAQGLLHESVLAFAAQMAAPALAAVVVVVLALSWVYRADLRGRYEDPAGTPVADPVLLATAAAACGLLALGVLAGLPPWMAASVATAPLVAVTARRRRDALTWRLVPVVLVAGTLVLFLGVAAAQHHGLSTALAHLAGHGDSLAGLLRLAAAGAVGSNAVNNLPAYLALEPVAGTAVRLHALLVGTNVGPLVTVWGSLATLLWRSRCASGGLKVGAWRLAALGGVIMPMAVVAAVAALWI